MRVTVAGIDASLGGSFIQYYFNEDVDPTTIKDDQGRYLLTNIRATNNVQPNALTGIGAGYNCGKGKLRFAFIGKLGTWEYYNIYNYYRTNINVTRESYDEQFVKTQDEIYNYDISNRGTKQFYTSTEATFEIITEALDRPTSNFLQDMFNSSEVYIQLGNNFRAINILNVDEEVSVDSFRRKEFRYTIQFKYSLDTEPR